MRIALAQYALEEKVEANLARVCDLMKEAMQEGADLILFPELCLTPFFPQFPALKVEHYAFGLEHPFVGQIRALCKQLGLLASPNIYLRDGNHCYDASLLIDQQGEVLSTSKMVHVAQLPGFYEQDYYQPSESGFLVQTTALGRIGTVVCFDRHYPESIRSCVLQGAEVILVPTANTVDEARDIYECELRAAAFQNGVFIAMCNRTGKEADATFCGESMVVDPHGTVLRKADLSETLLLVDLDLSEVQAARRQRPYLALLRPDLYAKGSLP
jgi:predicted amidohydrolase